MRIRPIVLASGFGRRFGGNKLLCEFMGKPLYRHIVDSLLLLTQEQLIEPPLVVTQYEAIHTQMTAGGIDCVMNSHASEGISASIKTGIAHSGICDIYLFLTADQPFLSAEILREFLIRYKEIKKPLGCMCCGDIFGTPALFPPQYKEELLALTGEKGGKAVIKNHLEDVFFFPVDEKVLRDIDFTTDLEE